MGVANTSTMGLPMQGIRFACLVAVLFAACLAGCDDPVSQKRIRMREERVQSFWEGRAGQMRQGARRINEVGPTMEKWWRQDVELFEHRRRIVGDYIW